MKTLKDLAAQYTWQPIETAPKDGADVLGYDYHWSENGVVHMFWDESFWQAQDREDITVHLKPTHWMPLPLSPRKTNSLPKIIEVTEQLALALNEADIASDYMGADARIGVNAALSAYTALVKELGG